MLNELKNTQRNRIKADIEVHQDIMDDYIAEGWTKEEASTQAMSDLRDIPIKNRLLRAAELRYSK